MKYLRPLYGALSGSPRTRALARELGADDRVVTVVQYLRVLVVLVTVRTATFVQDDIIIKVIHTSTSTYAAWLSAGKAAQVLGAETEAAADALRAVREKEIIFQIISLDKKTAADVMTPRSKMSCIPDDLTVEQMIADMRREMKV